MNSGNGPVPEQSVHLFRHRVLLRSSGKLVRSSEIIPQSSRTKEGRHLQHDHAQLRTPADGWRVPGPRRTGFRSHSVEAEESIRYPLFERLICCELQSNSSPVSLFQLRIYSTVMNWWQQSVTSQWIPPPYLIIFR